jgi:hypothetical protein
MMKDKGQYPKTKLSPNPEKSKNPIVQKRRFFISQNNKIQNPDPFKDPIPSERTR